MKTQFNPAELMPQDTLLACPKCGTHDPRIVLAYPPKADGLDGVRLQDRWCCACQHRWVTVLPPETFVTHFSPHRIR